MNQTWGVSCSQACGHCSTQAPQCNSITGLCVDGCSPGYTGDSCTTETGENPHFVTNICTPTGGVFVCCVASFYLFYNICIWQFWTRNYIVELYPVQDLTLTIVTDTSVNVQWTCQGLTTVSPQMLQFYCFQVSTSASSSSMLSTQLTTVISGAAPPSGVYDILVTVTPCRTQNGVTVCDAGLSQTSRTPCRGLSFNMPCSELI